MDYSSLLFYFLQFLILFSALGVVLIPNPIYCSLFLVLSMVGVAALFASLEAMFVAGVQLVVYAGAVMVLFVMVVMLFNLRKESRAFTRGLWGQVLKVVTTVGTGSMIAAALVHSFRGRLIPAFDVNIVQDKVGTAGIKEVAEMLFIKYVFGFEVICILLLLVIVGSVSLARAKGGTHA